MQTPKKIILSSLALVLFAVAVTSLAIHRPPSSNSDWHALLKDQNSQNVQVTSSKTSTSKRSSSTKSSSTNLDTAKDTTGSPKEVMVDIKGAVRNPGVYAMQEGKRVTDAVQLAGGLLKDANSNAINLSQHVTDEMVIYVPKKGESGSTTVATTDASTMTGSPSSPAGVTTSPTPTVHLNHASLTDLENLPGIGPAKAQAIFSYRETNGPFKTIDDLANVTGIGDKTIERLSPYLVLN